MTRVCASCSAPARRCPISWMRRASRSMPASPLIRQPRHHRARSPRRGRLHRGNRRDGVSGAGCADQPAGAGHQGGPGQQGHAEHGGQSHDGANWPRRPLYWSRKAGTLEPVWVAASAASCCRLASRGVTTIWVYIAKDVAGYGSRSVTRGWIRRVSRRPSRRSPDPHLNSLAAAPLAANSVGRRAARCMAGAGGERGLAGLGCRSAKLQRAAGGTGSTISPPRSRPARTWSACASRHR